MQAVLSLGYFPDYDLRVLGPCLCSNICPLLFSLYVREYASWYLGKLLGHLNLFGADQHF